MTVGNLSRELLVTQHSGSELVERLVAKGLLVREPGLQDRRPMLLWVTPAASKLYQPPYPVTVWAQLRLVSEAIRSGIRMSLFQPSQHASMIAS